MGEKSTAISVKLLNKFLSSLTALYETTVDCQCVLLRLYFTEFDCNYISDKCFPTFLACVSPFKTNFFFFHPPIIGYTQRPEEDKKKSIKITFRSRKTVFSAFYRLLVPLLLFYNIES